MIRRASIVVALIALAGCEDKKPASEVSVDAASSIAARELPTPPVAPPPSAVPSAAESAAAAAPAGDTKDVVVTIKDATKDPDKTVKVQKGGTVTLYLPDARGSVWSVDSIDRSLGKPKEEVIPGFAPSTNGHQFTWSLGGPLLHAGEKHTVKFVNKKLGDKTAPPSGTFTLTLDLS